MGPSVTADDHHAAGAANIDTAFNTSMYSKSFRVHRGFWFGIGRSKAQGVGNAGEGGNLEKLEGKVIVLLVAMLLSVQFVSVKSGVLA